jgi:hypothetical protein
MVDQIRVGNRLFGRAARPVLAAWVSHLGDDVFFQAEAVTGTGLPQSNVREELRRLAELDMITELPREAGDRRKHYLRTTSPLWGVIRVARQAIAAVPTAGTTSAASHLSDSHRG